jgi:primosomal protein N' (replication factor Y) (superfamily II helicase)
MIEVGSAVRVPFGSRNVRGVVVGLSRSVPARALGTVLALVVEPPVAPPPLDRLFEWVALRYAAPRGVVLRRALPPRVRVRPDAPRPLTGGPQTRALRAYEGGLELAEEIAAGAEGVWILRTGVGGDRTDIVADLVAAAARAGSGAALVTVPEVRYGSAVLDALERHWPDLARVDSARSEPERTRAWLRLAAGHGLGGGGRSAVLAPCPHVRLIVVDEAHHSSYKEDRAPRIDARRVALRRAQLQGAACVFLSPTPPVELGGLARWGRARLLEPDRAAARRARPIIELVERPAGRAISHQLHTRLRTVLAEGRGAALLAPRRGFARALWCAACRRSLRCPRCEAGVGTERARGRVRCPRCGLAGPVPVCCRYCGASEWRQLGAGSERLAEQVASSFPRAKVIRMDPDVIESATGSPEDADIYVTTWIGTKAAIRPPVGLVGVIDADALIRRPHFRSAESAYQALAEMAAWAGPASAGGRVVIQTSEPSHHSVQAVVRADYGYFLDRELAGRAELAYPPFGELVKLSASGPGARDLVEEAGRAIRPEGGRMLGPVVAHRSRAGRSEGALEALVKCPDAEAVAEALRSILGRVPAGSRLVVDVDPR